MQLDIVSPVVGDDTLSGLGPGVLDLSICETLDLAVQNFLLVEMHFLVG